MRKTFADTVLEVGQIDPKLVVLVGDLSHFALQPFAEACPGRFHNVGILEPTIMSMGAGLARAGLHPVVHSFAPFIVERCFEQIKMDFCYQELGGTIISVGSAFDFSGLGCSHFCYDDIALIKSLPRTQIVYPAMPKEMNLLFKETNGNEFVTYFRLPALPQCKHGVEIDDDQIVLGRTILIKPGTDITIVAAGPQLRTAMESVPLLARKGIDAEVLYPLTVKPFDYETVLGSVRKTGRYLVIEEHCEFGGIGDEVMRAVKDLGWIQSTSLAIKDRFCHGYGSYEDHLVEFGFTKENVVRCSIELCS
ncbi:MAG: hypothetical protein GY847_40035 [Proteobacteria bacterium]|nr:hypothetical protein [Pseudomonadota bacterium]